MKSPFYFIVESLINKRYNNTKTISGLEVITSTSEEDYISSNRLAKVIEVPLGYKGPISSGDTLIVHHNVFKYYYDMKGNQKSGKSFFKDDKFFIEPDQFYMYKKNGTWYSYDKYCFVKPIDAIDSYIKKPFSDEPLMGEMLYPNDYLISKGINKGDIVCFSPDSEYEFTVDDVKMYRIIDNQITMKLN